MSFALDANLVTHVDVLVQSRTILYLEHFANIRVTIYANSVFSMFARSMRF